jgi:hypothetical protein
VGSAAVDTFWKRANGFLAFSLCMWLIALEALGGLTTEVKKKKKKIGS